MDDSQFTYQIAYGLTEDDNIMERVWFFKLKTGDEVVSYACEKEGGYISFLPMRIFELEEQHGMLPYLPYTTDCMFFFKEEDVVLIKRNTIKDYLKDSYEKYVKNAYPTQIELLDKIYEMNFQERKMTETKSMILPSHLSSFQVH